MSGVRPICIDGERAYVPLTRDYVAIIDAADASEVGRHNWHALVRGKQVYAGRQVWQKGKNRSELVLLHRQLTNPTDGVLVDHRDGDGLNNRRVNLRQVNRAQNAWNATGHHDSTSGLKGVSWISDRKVWRAEICRNGKRLHLGSFQTPEEAHAAYAAAAVNLHGEFARIL